MHRSRGSAEKRGDRPHPYPFGSEKHGKYETFHTKETLNQSSAADQRILCSGRTA